MEEHKDGGFPITRRDLLRGAAYTSLGIALGIKPLKAAEKSKPATQVVIVRAKDVLAADGAVNKARLEEMLDRGMQELLGAKKNPWREYFRPEDAVGVKISKMMTPTHPELTDAILERLKGAGVTKMEAWDRDAKKPEQFTALINVPGMKSHWLSGAAFSIKNYCGCYPTPSQLHGDACADLAKMWEHPTLKGKTRLIIVDGLRALYHGGPQVDPRYLWDYQGLVFGTDPVAVDAVCLDIIQKKRNEVQPPEWLLSPPPKHIEVADKKYGLGTSDLTKIKVVKIDV
jgi:hypothetical protein